MENKYSNILDSYTKRLISTSSRSRTIFFGKDSAYGVDLFPYLKFSDSKHVYEFLIGERDELILSKPNFNYKNANSLFEKYHYNEISKNDILKIFPYFSEADFLTLQESEPNEQVYTKFFNKYDKYNAKLFKQISKINDNNKSIKKESGKDDLYIGYPYIEGQFYGGKVVRAPLVLHKVSIEENSNKITIINDKVRILNPVFVMSYLVENEKKYKDHLDFEIVENNYLDIADLILKKIGIEVTKEFSSNELSHIPQMTKKEFIKVNNFINNSFKIKNHLTLGIFPLSNKKIYDDVKDLSVDEEINEMLNSFYDSSSEVDVFNDNIEDIDEDEIKYITTLDFSQKRTLIEAIRGNHIIQGPPGTGKSQVIANIVANLLLKQKKVLVCSEKRTATDVIYNRLGKLAPFSLLLHDQIVEKEYFYESIDKAINTIKEYIGSYKNSNYPFNQDKYINNFFSASKLYDQIINKNYHGLTYKEVFFYKDKKVNYLKEIKILKNNHDDIEKLRNALYEYGHSDEFGMYKELDKEIQKDFYTEYNLSLNNDIIYKLKDLEDELKTTSNNYVINIKIDNLINSKNEKISFIKKLFSKNQPLTELSKDFLDKTKHDFSTFKGKLYKDDYSKALLTLKIVNRLSDNEIIEEYKKHIATLSYLEIDHQFINEYTLTYNDNKRKTFNDMATKVDDSIEFICRSVSADIKESLSNPSFNGKLQQLLGEAKKKRKKPIKVIVDEYFDILQILFPVWIMTPDVVSAILPLQQGLFDKAIFDEASQLFIEKAIPTIARSKSIVICGDSKQLRPTLFFENRYEDDEEQIEDIEQESAISETSLLDYATSSNKYKSSMLTYHYRCNHKELINFSSYAFYNGQLTFASKNDQSENFPIETINVVGNWDGKVNEEEAKTVVETVKNILKNRKFNETIGIVTLNVHQRDLIMELLDTEFANDKILGPIYNKEKERKNEKNNEDESIFVKNLEGVQGDERDIIIFSIAYSKNNKGNIGSALGELQRIHGENRLNVAISRAKRKIYIVKSFMGDELDINEENKGPYYFKKYLQYSDYLNKCDHENANQLLFNLSETNTTIKYDKFDDEFQEEIFHLVNKIIDNSRYELRSQVLIGSFKIDMVIFDKLEEHYKLGIQCIGNTYHNNPSEVTNDIYKQRYLDIRGWNIHWLFESDYINNKDEVILKLTNIISNITV